MRAVVRFTAIPAFVAASILSGCGEDKTVVKPTPPGPSTNPFLSTPQKVLEALETAYSHRDSTGTKALYDSSYTGVSEDLNDPPGTTPLFFDYYDEASHVAALARNPMISSIVFTLGPPASWTRLGSGDPSHPEWASIQIAGSSVAIEITDGQTTYTASGSSEFFEFLFKPSTPQSTSPTDTLWRIVRWRESRSAGP